MKKETCTKLMNTKEEFDNYMKQFENGAFPINGLFDTSPELKRMVEKNGSFLPVNFHNVIGLIRDKDCKRNLQKSVEKLYEADNFMLANSLQDFHIRLLEFYPGEPGFEHCSPIVDLWDSKSWKYWLKQWTEEAGLDDTGEIVFNANYYFNMVSTAIVVGLTPKDEENFEKLKKLYFYMEKHIPKLVGVIPHIPLVYFVPGTYDMGNYEGVKQVLNELNHQEKLEVRLSFSDLKYVQFENMNDYEIK